MGVGGTDDPAYEQAYDEGADAESCERRKVSRFIIHDDVRFALERWTAGPKRGFGGRNAYPICAA
jgi:hypothetical protein